MTGVKACRFYPINFQGRVVGHAHAEAIGLHPAVAFADMEREVVGEHRGQQAARGVAGDYIRVHHVVELVYPVEGQQLDAVECLVVSGVSFAPDRIAHAGFCHQVAFVGGVDEQFGLHLQPAQHLHGGDAGALHERAVEILAGARGEAGGGGHAVHDFFRDAGLEIPFLVLAVFASDLAIKLAGHAADDVFFAVVGPAEAAGGEATEVASGLQEHDGFSESREFVRGHDAGGRAAVDADVRAQALVCVRDPVWIEIMQAAEIGFFFHDIYTVELWIISLPAPDIQDQLVAAGAHAGVDAVAGGEDVAAAGHPVAGGLDDLLLGAGVHQAAVHVADQAEAVAVQPLDFGDVHAALRVEGVERVGVGLHEAVEDGHDVAVGVFYDIKAELALRGDLGLEAGEDKLVELRGGDERAGVEAIIGAEGEAVAGAVAGERGLFLEGRWRRRA